MKRLIAVPFTLAVTLGALAGCGSATNSPSAGAASATAAAQPAASGQSMAGMVMPGTPAATAPGKPTDTQALICGGEIKDTVKQVLQLAARPTASTSFAGGLYTCSYHLPMGTMRLSVQHLASDAAARAYLVARSRATKATGVLPGLGAGAYGDGNGVVFTIKDDEVLEVDTNALPAVFGAEQQRRSDLAYEIASDVLGCWTGDDS